MVTSACRAEIFTFKCTIRLPQETGAVRIVTYSHCSRLSPCRIGLDMGSASGDNNQSKTTNIHSNPENSRD